MPTTYCSVIIVVGRHIASIRNVPAQKLRPPAILVCMAAVQPRSFLVTGAGRGIGRGLTRLLLQKGHKVFLIDSNKTELDHIALRLGEQHNSDNKFEHTTCNVRVPEQIHAVISKARTFFEGHLACLINNAAYTGGVGGQHLAELTLEEWNKSIETNLTGPMLMSQACLPLLQKSTTRQQGGCIINMSSTRAFMSELNNEAYSTTKAGLLGLSQAMAVSLAPQGIRVNAILPGWINVANECKAADESGAAWEDGLSSSDHEWHLTGRVGKVEDVLRAVEYLVESDFVTGSEVVIDGGVTRKMVYPE